MQNFVVRFEENLKLPDGLPPQHHPPQHLQDLSAENPILLFLTALMPIARTLCGCLIELPLQASHCDWTRMRVFLHVRLTQAKLLLDSRGVHAMCNEQLSHRC